LRRFNDWSEIEHLRVAIYDGYKKNLKKSAELMNKAIFHRQTKIFGRQDIRFFVAFMSWKICKKGDILAMPTSDKQFLLHKFKTETKRNVFSFKNAFLVTRCIVVTFRTN
jgi:hypothetical protein